MKFSILIPSKNGEKYIENCIRSVLDQNFTDYEIIIGNNNNNEKFNVIMSKYSSNKKIIIVNHHSDIAVTDNWQSCLLMATGDYVIMLGDDDCLLQDSLKTINDVIISNNYPECLSFNGISFYSNNSLENIKFGSYKNIFFDYQENQINEGLLSKNKRIEIVKKMFNFENKLPLNMQPHIISRIAINKIEKNIYQPPFPDHYALNALLLTSDSWLISYKKIVAVGISDKSFGHYYFNSKLSDGIKYLGLKIDLKNQIDGSILNTCMMIWLLNIKKDYPIHLKKVKVKRSAYLYRQVFFMFSAYFNKSISFFELLNFFINLKYYDKLAILILPFQLNIIIKGINKIFFRKNVKVIELNNHINIYEFTRKNKF